MSFFIPLSCRVLLFVLLFNGCGLLPFNFTQDSKPGARPQEAEGSFSSSTSLPRETSDLDKLARLWEMRSQENAISDYPIGAGDVIEISVSAVEELRSRVVRVSGDGMISLPYIGKVQAAGLTEEELRERLGEQLKKYMYNPRIVLFVKEYRSRQVAVLGSVGRPGLYSLNSGADTILDMISQAGGISPGANPHIYLIPAEPVEAGQAKQVIAALPGSFLSQDPAPAILKRTDPILIDIKELAMGGYQHYLSLTARPGDVIMVPGGGQVLVEGWVEKPGSYSVFPGLTLSGVVAAAGGPMYPADVNTVKIMRSEKEGKKSFLVADLEKIKRGELADITLQGGDIVEVSSTTSKLVSYRVYSFLTTVMHIAVGGSVGFK